jgi:septum formation protein
VSSRRRRDLRASRECAAPPKDRHPPDSRSLGNLGNLGSLHPAPHLILASGSPRRREFLSQLGLPFQVIVSGAPEDVLPGLDPETVAIRLAEQKARAVAATLDDGLVLGADTIVVLDSEILGKPVDDGDAARMLRRLSGREHQVITGLALTDAATGDIARGAVTSVVRFHRLSDDHIAAYVATGEPRDKAGAYAIQGSGGELIAGLDGCFNNVVGLPLCAVARLLKGASVAIPESWPGCLMPDGSLCPNMV